MKRSERQTKGTETWQTGRGKKNMTDKDTAGQLGKSSYPALT